MPPRRRRWQRFHYTVSYPRAFRCPLTLAQILNCTINTNVAATSEEEEEDIAERLRTYLDEELFPDADKLAGLVIMHHGTVEHLEIEDGEVEVGDDQRRVHAHFQMTIIHSGSVNLGPMQRHWQEVIGRDLSDIAPRGIYVRLDRVDSRAQDYAIKNAETIEDIIGRQ